ncbi:hypothetical protein [Shimia biformata]|uniref:hypothetical protein n=1 Tax=Shimia biformata TaxID=1294299 RepID=UPI001951C4AF|nr:hypothetical protein [Shimia biformata]
MTSPPILIHAGFHKTGTSTVQGVLRENKAALRKLGFPVLLRWKLRPAVDAARGYSASADPVGLAKFGDRVHRIVADLPPLERRGLIVSAEELSGHLPGRDGIVDYRAAVPLVQEIVAAFGARYGAERLRFVYTTRARDTWIDSAYWEHVKAGAMTDDLEAFRNQMSGWGGFPKELDRIADAVAPVPVTALALEATADERLGPAAPILRLAGLGNDALAGLTAVGRANTRLDAETRAAFLAINRAEPDRDRRAAAKRALLEKRTSQA